MSEPAQTPLVQIEERLAELTDLFRRRLMDDKVKQRALDELHGQLEFAREGLADQFLLPLVREVLLLADRLESAVDDDPRLGSVRDELLEILYRRGLEEVPDEGLFDATIHEAVAREAGSNLRQEGEILSVRRRGYTLNGRLIRPAHVVVGSAAADDAPAPSSHALDVGRASKRTTDDLEGSEHLNPIGDAEEGANPLENEVSPTSEARPPDVR